MAPVSCGSHGTHQMVRTGSDDGSGVGNQRRPRSVDGGETTARSRFDDHQIFAGALPSFVKDRFRRGLWKLSQRIRNHDEIMLLTKKAGAQVLLEPLRLWKTGRLACPANRFPMGIQPGSRPIQV